MHVEDVVVVGLAHGVGRHAAIGAVVGLVEVLDVQVGAGDHGVRRHVLVHPQPGDPIGAGERAKTGEWPELLPPPSDR